MSDSALEQALWCKDRVVDTARYQELEKRFPMMVGELKKRGMTLQWLWKQYLEEHADGYRYSQFCLHFERWSAAGELWMHQEHKAGDRMYVDWAGEPLLVVNANTGEHWPVDIFVGILGATGLKWLSEVVSVLWKRWPMILGAALVIVVLFLRGGLVEAWTRAREAVAARRAARGAGAEAGGGAGAGRAAGATGWGEA